MNKKYIICNWKAYLSDKQSLMLAGKLKGESLVNNIEMIVLPSVLSLKGVNDLFTAAKSSITCGSQVVTQFNKGAYTGDITISCLKEFGVKYALVGHSEQRLYHKHSDQYYNIVIKSLLKAGIHPIICVGESRDVYSQNKSLSFVKRQLKSLLYGVNINKVIVAYEPIWSISGFNPREKNIDLTHLKSIAQGLNSILPSTTPLLYGGSVNVENIEMLCKLERYNGFLIGSAGTKYASVKRMLKSITKTIN